MAFDVGSIAGWVILAGFIFGAIAAYQVRKGGNSLLFPFLGSVGLASLSGVGAILYIGQFIAPLVALLAALAFGFGVPLGIGWFLTEFSGKAKRIFKM